MTQKRISSRTQKLVECAIMLAIATVLSIFPKFEGVWANGGSITVCSMLPIILISYKFGMKWGLLTGFAFSLLQLLTGGFYPAGISLVSVVMTLLLDYILPYTIVGLGGMFKNKIKNVTVSLALGTVSVLIFRYLFHILSGYVLWKNIEVSTEFLSRGFAIGTLALNSFTGDALCLAYSVIYNGSYMVPEIIITTIGVIIASKIKPLKLY